MEATATKRSLFDISEDLLAFDAMLEELGGDVSDPATAEIIEKFFAELSAELESKADGYCYLIAKLDMEAAAALEQKERFGKREKTRVARIVFLKDRLKAVMEGRGLVKIEASHHTVAIQKNGGKQAMRVIDEKLIPSKFFVTIPEHAEIDQDKLRAALEAGEDVAGAELLPRGTSLRIR